MIKTYTTRANALRALKSFDIEAVKHAKELIVETDGTWSFDNAEVEKFLVKQEEIDNEEADVFAVFAQPKPARNTKAHEANLDAAYRALEERAAMGEDMSAASVDENTYEIIKTQTDNFASVTEQEHAEHRGEIKAQSVPRDNMKTSLKLNRTINCLTTGETFKNAHQMWKAHTDWMTTGQQDRLTAQLYKAAKEGEFLVVTINERKFQLA